jgi:hypothetical protein
MLYRFFIHELQGTWKENGSSEMEKAPREANCPGNACGGCWEFAFRGRPLRKPVAGPGGGEMEVDHCWLVKILEDVS